MSPFASSRLEPQLSHRLHERSWTKTEETFRLLIEHATDIVAVVDEKGTIQYENPRVTQVLGYDPRERIGLNVFSFIHPDDLDRARTVFSKLLDQDHSTFSAEFRYQHKDGSWKHLEAAAINLVHDPLVNGVLVNARDVTHFVEGEVRLQHAERELAAAQRIANTGSWQWNLADNTIHWSDELYRVYGMDPQSEDLTFNVFLSFASSPEEKKRVEKEIQQALSRKSSFSYIHSIRRRDGNVRYLDSRGKVDTDKDGRAVRMVGVCRDITEEWHVRLELERAYAELEKRVEERTEELSYANEKLREEHDRMSFLARTSALLSSSLNHHETIKNIASMTVPSFADWCAVDLLDGEGNLVQFTVANNNPQKVAWAQEIHQKYPPDKSSPNGVYEAIRLRKTLLFPRVTDEMIRSVAKDEDHLRLLRDLGMTSVIIVPLFNERSSFGAITFIRASQDGRDNYKDDDIPFVELLAHKAGLAIRNAQLYSEAHDELVKRRDLEKRWMRTYRELNKANKLFEHHVAELEYAKEELRHKKAKDEAILENIGEGLVVVDENDHVVLTNRAAELLLLEKRHNMIGKHSAEVLRMTDEMGEIIPLNKRPCAFVSTKNTSQISTSDNRYYTRSNGTHFPVSVTASPIVVEGLLRGKVIVFKDVTREKQIDQAKNEFISIASHQLRTPLSTINWYAETLLMQADKNGTTNEKNVKYLQRIHEANQRLIRLVNSLLNVSRLELGTVIIEPQPIHIVPLIKEVIGDLRGDISERGVTIEETYGEELPHVQLDPKITQIVVQNLISNAIKYIPQNRERKIVRVSVTAGSPPSHRKITNKKDESGIIIQVSDNGYGISQKDRKHIFGKFFRADITQESNYEGSGLGLYIAKKLTELMGGKIWLRSQVNKGSTFYIYLPKENVRVQIPLQPERIET